jgi:hypothetical protein
VLIRAAERGANLGTITAALMRLLAQTSAAELHCRPLSWRRSSVACRIRTPCVWPWRAGASNTVSHRRSASDVGSDSDF